MLEICGKETAVACLSLMSTKAYFASSKKLYFMLNRKEIVQMKEELIKSGH